MDKKIVSLVWKLLVIVYNIGGQEGRVAMFMCGVSHLGMWGLSHFSAARSIGMAGPDFQWNEAKDYFQIAFKGDVSA